MIEPQVNKIGVASGGAAPALARSQQASTKVGRTARQDPGDMKKALLLGSGGLRIGQAGEFDYSGSQAIKALKEEGIETILVNPNIATVQTDSDMADKVYFSPLTVEVVSKIIDKERPDVVLLSFGGQTALNLGLVLHDQGILKKYGVKTIGTPIATIKATEDREIFKQVLNQIGTKTARSVATYSVSEALAAAEKIGYPVMMRSGFSLGGLGSGKVENASELKQKVSEVFHSVDQVLIEEYLLGWKEIEYEVVRDHAGDTITVCNMENLDPMGIHTGESIVVAPSQTLTNAEYHGLREVAIKTINHLGIVGECNIQYALNPANGDYRVIEVNARLSRSSALASKATGYPLAFVATKLMLGYRLHELKNSVTGVTSAFYEPALDYIAVKMPRWDLTKLKTDDITIGSEMKSVGEVMALGRSFPEALQKAIRMLNIGANGLTDHPHEFKDPEKEIKHATYRRIFALYEAFKGGSSVAKIQKLSHIDPWFLQHIEAITKLDMHDILRAKQMGFSDKTLAKIQNINEAAFRKKRIKLGIKPVIKQIDTLAGEFAAQTNYLYTTYHGSVNDVEPQQKATVVLGSGPYCIGSSVEFDWCAINAVKALRAAKHKTIIINSNPETVSTDFDSSDRLYFDELTLERVQDIADFEAGCQIMVSVGGQIPNNLALPLEQTGYKVLGTSPKDIDRAENRQKFSSMLEGLAIDQPAWSELTSLSQAKRFAAKVGYPVLIRPSYVLSGGAMRTVTDEKELETYLRKAVKLSPDHPVVISQFITEAKEIEIDGVAKDGKILIHAVSEHIENAGIHSGDATIVLPAHKLYLQTARRIAVIAEQIVDGLHITGPFNIQFMAKENAVMVIECNVRASRSFPFVSKVMRHNFITVATKTMLGLNTGPFSEIEPNYVAVKSPQFSYNRLKGADPVASVEMASTGEVACLGANLLEAFYMSWLATEQKVAGKNVCISLPDEQKHKYLEEVEALVDAGWNIYATTGTHAYFMSKGIKTKRLFKYRDKREPSLSSYIAKQKLDLVVCVPSAVIDDEDSYTIRRLAIDNHTPLQTNAETGRLLLRCLTELNAPDLQPKAWQDYSIRTLN